MEMTPYERARARHQKAAAPKNLNDTETDVVMLKRQVIIGKTKVIMVEYRSANYLSCVKNSVSTDCSSPKMSQN